ncbi:iron chaperone [Shewanella acanthi]|uniref:iron chaperone n=1 Tax=Shewanella acanthi TaxID=2864212 RepID=UPI001C657451|nr:DUF1801 domain-containing protein [Shewanella acanthi]QYJ80124.1 hypothetical protein K0H61_07015 [Shewanella acanthi]
MSNKPETIAEYIENAAPKCRAHLEEMYIILKTVAPNAQEAIKWGHPFFIEPRFLFSFSAHKEHMGFATTNAAIEPHLAQVKDFEITQRGILKIPYRKALPKSLVMAIATTQLQLVSTRNDDNFW